MNCIPVSVARWPRSTAALFTLAIHLMPVAAMLGMASSNQQIWQQVSIDAPVITASLITQVATAPEPVLVPAPVITPPEPAPQQQPHKLAPPTVKPPVPVVPPPETAITQQAPPAVTPADPALAPVPGPVDDTAAKAGSTPASAPVTQHRGDVAPAMNRQAQPDHAYNPPPPYPSLLRQQGIDGVVTLRVLVGPQGQPQEVQVQASSGYRLMDDAAVRAVRRWRFIPALHNGQPEPGWVEFPIRFSLKD